MISPLLSPKVHGPRVSWFDWEGLRLLCIENECIRLVLWPEHGADILEFRHKATDLDILWKNPQVWPPRKDSLAQPHQGRSEFYDVFHGGWFTSLPNGFFPGDYYGAAVGCHGELQSVPWQVESISQEDDSVCVTVIGRSVRTPWILRREYTLESGSSQIQWTETLHNRSAQKMPAAWLHHPGFGGPLIEGARIVTNACTVVVPPAERKELSQLEPSYVGSWPHVPLSIGGETRDCSLVPTPDSGIEHVIHLKDFSQGCAAIWNDQRHLGFSLRWDKKIFPYAWSWASGQPGGAYPLWSGCHTITIQPSTSPMLSFPDLLQRNELLWIEAGQELSTTMSAGFINSVEEFA